MVSQPSPLVLPFTTLGEQHRALAGSKALTLAQLQRAGLPVPPGFCVLAAVHRRYLELENRLDLAREALEAPSRRDRQRALARLREALQHGVPPQGLEAALREGLATLGPGPWAVRSSATAEDLPEHSFAGQHESYLDVEDLPGCLAAVQRCWASLWSERAVPERELE